MSHVECQSSTASSVCQGFGSAASERPHRRTAALLHMQKCSAETYLRSLEVYLLSAPDRHSFTQSLRCTMYVAKACKVPPASCQRLLNLDAAPELLYCIKVLCLTVLLLRRSICCRCTRCARIRTSSLQGTLLCWRPVLPQMLGCQHVAQLSGWPN